MNRNCLFFDRLRDRRLLNRSEGLSWLWFLVNRIINRKDFFVNRFMLFLNRSRLLFLNDRRSCHFFRDRICLHLFNTHRLLVRLNNFRYRFLFLNRFTLLFRDRYLFFLNMLFFLNRLTLFFNNNRLLFLNLHLIRSTRRNNLIASIYRNHTLNLFRLL